MHVKRNRNLVRTLTDDSTNAMKTFINRNAFFVKFEISSYPLQALRACQVNVDDVANVEKLSRTLLGPFNVDCKHQVRAT